MIEIVSTFEGTPIVPADTGGAHVVDAGTSLTLSAGNTHGSATYEWELGDGATATGPSVTHVYAEDGVYVAKLTVTVNEPGGARSRHFARVEVRNVAPTVDAGGDRTVDEGEVVSFTGTFTDPEWPDTHEATWSWGDYQGPTAAAVSEANQPPSSSGTASASHAWGDNGVYTVRLTVRDDDGGVGEDTAEVTVLNVPPTVDAGPELFAYPCTVITLEGRFTDPGWLDTHIASWSFGDCTPPRPALMQETHEPPAGEGTAVASHVYHQCGTYHAVCRVEDDDGGVGEDATVIRVVDVANADFEGGFRARRLGAVANGWEPYALGDEKEFGEEPLAADEYLVHGGQRAQRVRTGRQARAGILQRVGANPGWVYQVSAWYSLHEAHAGTARLGVDPAGGTDPDAPGVEWAAGDDHRDWSQLVARVSTSATAITIFLESDPGEGQADACFDDVELVPIQPFCRPAAPKPEARCVDFADFGLRTPLPAEFEHDGFMFTSLTGDEQWVVAWGDPEGVGKLTVQGGVDVRLPFPAASVEVRAGSASGKPVTVTALDTNDDVLSHADEPPYELAGPGIVALRVEGGGREGLLIEICARPGEGEERPPRKPRRPDKTHGQLDLRAKRAKGEEDRR